MEIIQEVKESEMQDHFLIDSTDSEMTENSFNSAMAEAMEILHEIQEIKKEN